MMTDRTRTRTRRLAALAACLALVAGCGGADTTEADDTADATTSTETTQATDADTSTASESDQEAIPVRFGIASDLAIYWPLYIGQEEGVFADNGLEMEIITTQSGSGADLIQLLLAKEVDIAAGVPDPAVAAAARNAEIVFLNDAAPLLYAFLGAEGYTTFDDLRESDERLKIAVSSPSTSVAALSRNILAANDISEDQYDLVVAGGSSERLAALETDTVDVAPLLQPLDFRAEDAGYTVLGYSDESSPFYGMSETSRPDVVADNCEMITRYYRAYAEIGEWFADPANQDRAVEILVDAIGVDTDIGTRTYELFQERSPFGVNDPTELVQGTFDMLLELGEVDEGSLDDPASVIDTSCLP